MTVLTFEPHPDAVLRGGGSRPRLSLPAERNVCLRDAGVHEIRVLRFTRDLAATDPEAFLARYVFPFYRVAWLVVGYDFAMGRDRKGTIPVLRRMGARLGFGVDAVSATEEGGAIVSSTALREALTGGDVEGARAALGRHFTLSGRVTRGSSSLSKFARMVL